MIYYKLKNEQNKQFDYSEYLNQQIDQLSIEKDYISKKTFENEYKMGFLGLTILESSNDISFIINSISKGNDELNFTSNFYNHLVSNNEKIKESIGYIENKKDSNLYNAIKVFVNNNKEPLATNVDAVSYTVSKDFGKISYSIDDDGFSILFIVFSENVGFQKAIKILGSEVENIGITL